MVGVARVIGVARGVVTARVIGVARTIVLDLSIVMSIARMFSAVCVAQVSSVHGALAAIRARVALVRVLRSIGS